MGKRYIFIFQIFLFDLKRKLLLSNLITLFYGLASYRRQWHTYVSQLTAFTTAFKSCWLTWDAEERSLSRKQEEEEEEEEEAMSKFGILLSLALLGFFLRYFE